MIRYVLLLITVFAAGGIVWTLTAREYPPGDPGDADQIELGKAVYGRDCARCHGDDLGGEFGWLRKENPGDLTESELELVLESIDDKAPAHDGDSMTWRHSDEKIFSIIKDGPEIALAKKNSRMPGFQSRLEDHEIWAVVAFLKSHWMSSEEAAQ